MLNLRPGKHQVSNCCKNLVEVTNFGYSTFEVSSDEPMNVMIGIKLPNVFCYHADKRYGITT